MKFPLCLILCLMVSELQMKHGADAFSVRNPSISYLSGHQEVDIGSSVELECSVQFAQDFAILWVKKGTKGSEDLPISSSSALIVRDSRYSLRHDKGSSTYILQIKDLQEYDAGTYMCQVIIDIKTRISESVVLKIRQPPTIFDNSTRMVVVTRQEAVKLECYAEGLPPPKISWRRENNAILPTGGSVFSGNQLLIPSIRKQDRGTYYCIAENGVGKGARRNVNVEVEFEPIVIALKPRVKQAQTFDALLECRVESYPAADINWILRSESIVTNPHYSISQFTTDDEFTDSVLTAKSIETRQYGNYTCQAKNRLGWGQASVILEESYSPICPPACELPYTYSSVERCFPQLLPLLIALVTFALI